MDKTQTLQVIISASIGGGFSLLTLLITLFYFRNKNRLEEEMLLQKIYSESPLSYIINKKEKSKYKKKESVTPNYYDIRFKEEEQIFLKQWNSMTKDRALDSDSKSKIMNEKGEEYTAMADMAWNSLDKGGRYHSAFLYILAAECYQLTGNYSRAG